MKITREYDLTKDLVFFESLRSGDVFIRNGSLCVKTVSTNAQMAIDLDNGHIRENMCGKLVIPVMAKVIWKKND